MHKNPPLFILNYWTLPQSHQPSQLTEHTHLSTDNHYKLLNTITILQSIIIDSWTRTHLQRQSLYTTEHAHNYTDNQYKQLNAHTMPPTIIINYWTHTQFHWHSL